MATQRLTQTELADRLGLSTRQVRNLEKAGVFKPRTQRGKKTYDWDQCREAYLKHKLEEQAQRAPPVDLRVAQAKKLEVDTQRAALELEKLRGRLVDLGYMEEQLSGMLQLLRAGLRNAPGKYAHEFVGLRTIPEAQARLVQVTDEILASLMDAGADPSLDDDPDADTEAA